MKFIITILPLIWLTNSEISNCEAYSKENSDICINCHHGYKRDFSKGCTKIHESSELSNFHIENCEVFYSESECLHCSSGYKLYNSRCSPICLENCSCFEPYECIEATPRKIQSCSDNCEQCTNSTTCNLCYNGYYLQGTNTCVQCSPGCLSCTNETVCTSCDYGYALGGTKCLPCSDSCETCYILNGDINNGISCDSCKTGFYLTQDQNCEICADPCNDCISNSTHCTSAIMVTF